MNKALSILFFEDHFVCTILPKDNVWESLRVDGSSDISLRFYVDGHGVRNDQFARERFEAQDQNAFGEFYARVASDEKFKRGTRELAPVEVMRDTLAQVRRAYVERMHGLDTRFDANAPWNIRTCFVPSVADEAKVAVTEYLASQENATVYDAEYFESLLAGLGWKGIISDKLNLAFIESAFGDLHLHYVEYNKRVCRHEKRVLVGKGVDSRIGTLARMLVESAVRQTRSHIQHDPALFESEVKNLHRTAAAKINEFDFGELTVSVSLSDLNNARVRIDQPELDRRATGTLEDLEEGVRGFVAEHLGVFKLDKVILQGDLLASGEFVASFEKWFGADKVIKSIEALPELLTRGVAANAPPDAPAPTPTGESNAAAQKAPPPPIDATASPGRSPAVTLPVFGEGRVERMVNWCDAYPQEAARCLFDGSLEAALANDIKSLAIARIATTTRQQWANEPEKGLELFVRRLCMPLHRPFRPVIVADPAVFQFRPMPAGKTATARIGLHRTDRRLAWGTIKLQESLKGVTVPATFDPEDGAFVITINSAGIPRGVHWGTVIVQADGGDPVAIRIEYEIIAADVSTRDGPGGLFEPPRGTATPPRPQQRTATPHAAAPATMEAPAPLAPAIDTRTSPASRGAVTRVLSGPLAFARGAAYGAAICGTSFWILRTVLQRLFGDTGWHTALGGRSTLVSELIVGGFALAAIVLVKIVGKIIGFMKG